MNYRDRLKIEVVFKSTDNEILLLTIKEESNLTRFSKEYRENLIMVKGSAIIIIDSNEHNLTIGNKLEIAEEVEYSILTTTLCQILITKTL